MLDRAGRVSPSLDTAAARKVDFGFFFVTDINEDDDDDQYDDASFPPSLPPTQGLTARLGLLVETPRAQECKNSVHIKKEQCDEEETQWHASDSSAVHAHHQAMKPPALGINSFLHPVDVYDDSEDSDDGTGLYGDVADRSCHHR